MAQGPVPPHLQRVPSPLNPLADTLKSLWETRAGEALRRVGLRSVRTTILTLAVLATLIPSLATGCLSYRQNRRAIEAKLNEQLASSSTQSAREVGLWVKERLYDLRVFATSYEVTDALERSGTASRRLADYLNSVDEKFADIQGLTVVAPDQRTIARTARAPAQLRLPDEWLRRARQGEPMLGDPIRPDSAHTARMQVAVPISNAAGRFLGVLVAQLDFRGVQEPVRQLLISEDGRTVVVRPDGRPIVMVGIAFDSVPAATMRLLMQSDGTATPYTAQDGVAVLAGVAGVPGTDWIAVAQIPASTAFADIRRLRNTTVLLVLVLLLAVGSVAYGLGLLVVLPLERLSHAADRVAHGDLDVAVPVSGGGEVSQLTGVFNDMVRRLREGRAELERLSVTDELTGLANRRQLDDELVREIQRHERHKRSFAVLMLDVDRFKALNDTHGHPAGDAVLRKLASVLQASTRKGDTVARFGGEEFMVILPETPAAGALTLAEKIRTAIEQTHFVVGGDSTVVPVTASIGLARFPDHGTTVETLVMVADEALYRSKQSGRNRVTTAD